MTHQDLPLAEHHWRHVPDQGMHTLELVSHSDVLASTKQTPDLRTMLDWLSLITGEEPLPDGDRMLLPTVDERYVAVLGLPQWLIDERQADIDALSEPRSDGEPR